MACLGKARIGSARHSPAWFGTGRHCPAALSSPSLSVRRAGAAAITWPPPRGGARRRRACAAVDGGHEAAAAGGAGGAGGGRAGRRPTALPRHGQQPRCGGPGSSSGLGEVLGRAARCRRTCSNCGVLYFLKRIAEVGRCGGEVEHRACAQRERCPRLRGSALQCPPAALGPAGPACGDRQPLLGLGAPARPCQQPGRELGSAAQVPVGRSFHSFLLLHPSSNMSFYFFFIV